MQKISFVFIIFKANSALGYYITNYNNNYYYNNEIIAIKENISLREVKK